MNDVHVISSQKYTRIYEYDQKRREVNKNE